MDLRTNISGTSAEQCDERRNRIEKELNIDLSIARVNAETIGAANEKNCEHMWGQVPLPLGLAGPLAITLSSTENQAVYLPLATTEGALVASVNRGAKAASMHGITTASTYRGISRSIAFKAKDPRALHKKIEARTAEWAAIGMGTSAHLSILGAETDIAEDYLFLTIWCDTDQAMGMNMTTIAAQAIGEWITKHLDATLVTVAANVDSDKKPSLHAKEHGRGFEVEASAFIDANTLQSVLKTDAKKLLETYHVKIELGSNIAGALGHNAHTANIIAALYLATGQDAAHVTEGSLSDTRITKKKDGIEITVRCPAILIGTIGGGTTLPVQKKCLEIMLHDKSALAPSQQVAEIIAAAVLAGELSLLAALSAQQLTSAHRKLGR